MPVSDINYNSLIALTDVVNNGKTAATAVDNTGASQGAIIAVVTLIIAGMAALNAKLDAEGGVNGTGYATGYNLTSLASRNKANGRGIHQGDLYAALLEMETNFNAALAVLDLDSGVADTTYNALGAVDLNDVASGTGLGFEDIVNFLDSFITNFNATLTKLDADA